MPITIDVLVAEIGSTTTVVNGFRLGGSPLFLGQGQARTSVLDGDVRIGLQAAITDLQSNLGTDKIIFSRMLATSSAAGGLKMTVHGLIYDMTVKAAREAALGAGGIIKLATAGKLRRTDIEKIRTAAPNLILLAGGVDYGERETALHNAELIAAAELNVPVVYAGNIENIDEIKLIFGEKNQRIYISENVYPQLDRLNIEPTRKIIHRVFEEHITYAPGMEHVRDMVSGSIIPTPGAVMECAQMLYSDIGDLLVLDVGGSTTDIHSVTDGSDEIAALMVSPEPKAKRTVEGDLGVFINAPNVIELIGDKTLEGRLGAPLASVLASYRGIPQNEHEAALARELTLCAAETALTRHAGHLRHIYTPNGRKVLAEGKDLTKIKWLVATGGALTRLPARHNIMSQIAEMNKSGMMLFPKKGNAHVLFDNDYIMASLGVLSREYPKEALALLHASLGI